MPRPSVLLGALRGRDCDHARNLAGLREDARPPRAVDARRPPGAHLMTVEDRLREAIADHVAHIPALPDAWDDVPLWPFRSQAEADAWRTAGGGHQPWHLDPDQTALSFTQGFLGFHELSTVVAHKVGAQDAHVSVGYNADGGPPLTAAVIHL